MTEKPRYYDKISLKNKTPEEAARIRKLFDDNIKIAYKIASKYYKTQYWDYEESLQIAQLGLWKACLIWDPDKYRISTLAYNIINRDFIDFDKQQKKQPDILFNLEDNCVTDDISLNEVLEDEDANVDDEFMENEEIKEINQDIIYILEDISDDLDIPKSIVKAVYLTYVESMSNKRLKLKSIDFISRQDVKSIITEFQIRLKKLLEEEENNEEY